MSEYSAVQFDGGGVLLNMQLTPRGFAQGRLFSFLDETGCIADCMQGSFRAAAWKFAETVERGGLLYAAGVLPEPDSWTTLLAAMEGRGESACDALCAVCAAAARAKEQGVPAAFVSPAAVLIRQTDGGITHVLFLPQTLSVQALQSGTESARQFGCWRNPGLTGDAAQSFTAAACVYYLLTGTVPYPEPDDEKREADRHDHMYIPLAVLFPDISCGLTAQTDCCLSYAPAASARQPADCAAALSDTICRELSGVYAQAQQRDQAAVRQRGERFSARRVGIVQKKRFVRRYSGIIAAVCIAVVIAVLAAASVISGNRNAPCVQGFTSREVVQAFYTGVQELDVTLMQAAAYKDAAAEYRDYISQLFVTSRMRQSVERVLMIPPARWLYSVDNDTVLPVGICRFSIDGAAELLGISVPPLKDAPEPLAAENGAPLADGDTAAYEVSYTYIAGVSDGTVVVRAVQDMVLLEFTGGSWRITSLDGQFTEHLVLKDEFAADFERRIDEGYTVIQAAALLEPAYPWLPTQAELEQERALLQSP